MRRAAVTGLTLSWAYPAAVGLGCFLGGGFPENVWIGGSIFCEELPLEHQENPDTPAHCKTKKNSTQGFLSDPIPIPPDTKLLLTKNYSEIIISEKLHISRVISGESPSFPEISRVHISSKIMKNNSWGIMFVIISCQGVKLCR